MQTPVSEIVYQWALLPDGDRRKAELEWEIVRAYPGVHGLTNRLAIAVRLTKRFASAMRFLGFEGVNQRLANFFRIRP